EVTEPSENRLEELFAERKGENVGEVVITGREFVRENLPQSMTVEHFIEKYNSWYSQGTIEIRFRDVTRTEHYTMQSDRRLSLDELIYFMKLWKDEGLERILFYETRTESDIPTGWDGAALEDLKSLKPREGERKFSTRQAIPSQKVLVLRMSDEFGVRVTVLRNVTTGGKVPQIRRSAGDEIIVERAIVNEGNTEIN
ncbi:MAG TPA: hypothetical protein PKG85_06045, partial [Mesotoga infera]|nr:hypothetical protein [Mesotoga infera]